MDAIAIGDLHLDGTRITELFGREAYDLQMRPVTQALTWAVERGIPRVVFLGDVFHRPRPSVDGIMTLLKVLLDFNERIDMHFILGNHDLRSATEPHSLTLLKRLTNHGRFSSVHVHDEPTTLDWDGVSVRMMPWGSPHPEGADLCFGHFARPGAVRDNGHAIALEDDSDAVEEERGPTYVVGHLHTNQRVGRTFFPGTMYQTSFGEADAAKYFALVRARKGRRRVRVDVKRVPVKRPFRLATVQLEKDDDWPVLPVKKRVRYRVLHEPGMHQPTNYMAENPCLVECRPAASKTHRMDADLAGEMEQVSGDTLEYKVTDKLRELLASWGMKRRDIDRAHRMVDRAVRDLGLD